MPVQPESITLEGLDGVVCRPQRRSRAGILLLPMLYGVDPTTRQCAARFAEAGYAAVIWDPYSGKGEPSSPKDGHKEFLRSLDDEVSRQEQQTWISYLMEHEAVEEVAAIGWCLGGRDVFRLAALDHRLSAVISCYPTIKTPLPDNQHEDAAAMASDVRCPVLMAYSGNERSTTEETLAGIERNLKGRHEATVINIHPRADHGYMDPLRHSGAENEAAARMTWALIFAFLGSSLSHAPTAN